jgi:menaquinone-9 beta-reductase
LAIIGGGVAGLTLANLMAEKGRSVIVFEKEKYPVRKVCGEYLSMEVWDFLIRLGLDLNQINPPRIKNLKISAPSGNYFAHSLDPGGFGLSRYFFDMALADLAKNKGATIKENCPVVDVKTSDDLTTIKTQNGYTVNAKIACGAFGKRSVMDKKLDRPYIKQRPKINYVGVKYHVEANLPSDQIELHIFKGGYCGISKVEDGNYCLCYLMDARYLKEYKDIETAEHKVLATNPFLKDYFSRFPRIEDAVTISQLSFGVKSTDESEILFLGDAAGFIAPLTGNGMSMAMRSANVLSLLLEQYFIGGNKDQLNSQYQKEWEKLFKSRVRRSLLLQRLFTDSSIISNTSIHILRWMPFLIKPMVKMTHGEAF